jgi:small subunit ribosomal protein S24e
MPSLLEIVVADEKKNPLLYRTEMKVQVKHFGQPTPTRQSLRSEIGRVSKASPERVYISRIITDYGAGISECIVNVYDKPELGEAAEEDYIRKRNTKPEAKKEAPPASSAPSAASPPVPTQTTTPESIKTDTKAEPKEKISEETAKPKAQRKKATKEKTAEPGRATEGKPSPEKKEPKRAEPSSS